MSNLAKRILTALIAIPIIVLITMAGGWYFFLFVVAASSLALIEFYRLAARKGAAPPVAFGAVAGAFINLTFFHGKMREVVTGIFRLAGIDIPFPSQAQLVLIVLVLIVAAAILIELFRNKGSAILNLAVLVFGIVYIPLFFGTLIGIRELFVPPDFPILRYFTGETAAITPESVAQVYGWGGYTVMSIFATIWICDTAAFHAGTVIGKHKLFPRVSPNKSWEGAIAGFLAAILTAVGAKYLVLPYLPLEGALLMGIIVGVAGQCGDLAESLLKRDAGVKDSSDLLPGHGGVFDRFDSLLFVSPLVYLYLDFILFTP